MSKESRWRRQWLRGANDAPWLGYAATSSKHAMRALASSQSTASSTKVRVATVKGLRMDAGQ